MGQKAVRLVQESDGYELVAGFAADVTSMILRTMICQLGLPSMVT